MRWLVAVKFDQAYKKVSQILGDYNEILPNIPTYRELEETIIGDEIDFAVIENRIHWRPKAEALLNEYKVPYIIFNGEFKDLEDQVANHQFKTAGPKKVLEEHQAIQPVQQTVELKKPQEEIQTRPASGSEPPAAPLEVEPVKVETELRAAPAEAPEPQIIYKEVTKYVDRTVEVPKYIDRPVEVPKYIDRPVEVPVEVIVNVPVEVEKVVNVPYLRTIPKQLIIIGSLYGGAGSSFNAIALAKVLNSLRVDTCVMECPVNEPYLYVTLDGSTRLPRDYSYIFPQIMKGEDIRNRTQEWQDEYITWMPSDPATGKLKNWTSEHMAKCLYGMKNAVTILDISTSWLEPGLKEVLLQADHILLVAGPEPARLLSSQSRAIKTFIRNELSDKVQVIANQVPEGRSGKTREWLESLPEEIIARIPGLASSDVIHASWEGRTVFDENEELVLKFTDCYFPLIRQIIPREYLVQRPAANNMFSWLKKMRGRTH